MTTLPFLQGQLTRMPEWPPHQANMSRSIRIDMPRMRLTCRVRRSSPKSSERLVESPFGHAFAMHLVSGLEIDGFEIVEYQTHLPSFVC